MVCMYMVCMHVHEYVCMSRKWVIPSLVFLSHASTCKLKTCMPLTCTSAFRKARPASLRLQGLTCVSAMATVVCSSCGEAVPRETVRLNKTTPDKEYFRCAACCNFAKNMQKAMAGVEPEVRDAFNDLPSAKRKTFREEVGSGALPEVLEGAIATFVSKTTTRSKSSGMEGSGAYMDSPDLAKKYKDKPDQLKNIRGRTDKMEDPIRGVTLYRDPSWVFKTEDKTGIAVSKKREASWSEKEPKKPKPEMEHKEKPKTEKSLTDAQRTKLNKLCTALRHPRCHGSRE